MGTPAVMNPHTIWAARGREQASRNASACVAAARDVEQMSYITFDRVVLIEHDQMADVGTLRLEPARLVFTGRLTRVIPFATVVLLGAHPLLGEPERNACSVNSSDHPARMMFLAEEPMEYHISAWYSRWLNNPFTGPLPPATVHAITPT